MSFLILNHKKIFFPVNTTACYQKPSLLFLTLAFSSISANVSGKIKYHDACHETLALMLIRENWHCIYLITNAGLLKIIVNAHVHILAKVKSKDCKSPISAANVQEKYLCPNKRGV